MELKIEETFCFTGHRPNKLYGYNKSEFKNIAIRNAIKDAIKLLYIKHNIRNFISGMALGVDQWAAEIVLELKEAYPDIKLIAAIPCRDHSSKWPQKSRDEYNNILDKCDYRVMVNKMRYFPQCMQIRNEWMVDRSIGQIAVWDGTSGGTGNCIKYADFVQKTKRITINPKTFNVQLNV